LNEEQRKEKKKSSAFGYIRMWIGEKNVKKGAIEYQVPRKKRNGSIALWINIFLSMLIKRNNTIDNKK